MAIFEWKDNYSVGSVTIDNQHKKLIGFINEFYDNLNTKSNDELISSLIKEMKEYTVFHFRYEESYLEKLGYEELPEHKQEHIDFIKKVSDFESRFNSKKVILSYEITRFLKEWLKHHILVEDMKYSKLIKKNEVVRNPINKSRFSIHV
jgi:hemerythrin